MVEPAPCKAGERVQVGRIVARVEGSSRAGFRQKRRDRRPLVGVRWRTDLEHLAPPTGDEPLHPRPCCDGLQVRARGRLIGGFAEVVRERKALVLDVAPDRVPEGGHPRREPVSSGDELEAVVPDVANARDADDSLRVGSAPTAEAGEEEVTADESLELAARILWNRRELGPGDDRRQRSVDVEDDRAPLGRLPKRREELGRHADQNTGVPRAFPSRAVFAGIGLAAGFFSALFGVGGGVVVVPLLVLLAGFRPLEAAATSLAAVGITALFGMAAFGILGEVSWADAVVVGLPAVAGVVVGTAVQQRVSSRLLTALLGALLVAIAIRLLLE
jgi:hypothetical protein